MSALDHQSVRAKNCISVHHQHNFNLLTHTSREKHSNPLHTRANRVYKDLPVAPSKPLFNKRHSLALAHKASSLWNVDICGSEVRKTPEQHHEAIRRVLSDQSSGTVPHRLRALDRLSKLKGPFSDGLNEMIVTQLHDKDETVIIATSDTIRKLIIKESMRVHNTVQKALKALKGLALKSSHSSIAVSSQECLKTALRKYSTAMSAKILIWMLEQRSSSSCRRYALQCAPKVVSYWCDGLHTRFDPLLKKFATISLAHRSNRVRADAITLLSSLTQQDEIDKRSWAREILKAAFLTFFRRRQLDGEMLEVRELEEFARMEQELSFNNVRETSLPKNCTNELVGREKLYAKVHSNSADKTCKTATAVCHISSPQISSNWKKYGYSRVESDASEPNVLIDYQRSDKTTSKSHKMKSNVDKENFALPLNLSLYPSIRKNKFNHSTTTETNGRHRPPNLRSDQFNVVSKVQRGIQQFENLLQKSQVVKLNTNKELKSNILVKVWQFLAGNEENQENMIGLVMFVNDKQFARWKKPPMKRRGQYCVTRDIYSDKRSIHIRSMTIMQPDSRMPKIQVLTLHAENKKQQQQQQQRRKTILDTATQNVASSVSTISSRLGWLASRPLDAIMSKLDLGVDVNIHIGSIHLEGHLGKVVNEPSSCN